MRMFSTFYLVLALVGYVTASPTPQDSLARATSTGGIYHIPSKSAAVFLPDIPHTLNERSVIGGILKKPGKDKSKSNNEEEEKKNNEDKSKSTTEKNTSRTAMSTKHTTKASTVVAAAATASPTKTNDRASASKASSSASQASSAACATASSKSKDKRKLKPRVRSVYVKPGTLDKHLKELEARLKKPENRCTNEVLLRDEQKKGFWYFAALDDNMAKVVKTIVGYEDIQLETFPGTMQSDYSSNGTVDDQYKKLPVYPTTARRESWITWLFRRLPGTTSVVTNAWSLARISVGQTTALSNPLPNPMMYTYPASAGEGVDIFVVDSAIGEPLHSEIAGRVTAFLKGDFSDNAYSTFDDHGVRVASVAAGRTMGVARKASIISVNVKLPQRYYSGQYVTVEQQDTMINANLVSAIRNARSYYQTRATRRNSVMILSQIAPYRHRALDSEVQLIIQAGMTFVKAGGNENVDACSSRATNGIVDDYGQITVGHTTAYDVVAPTSNYGRCIHIFAPGRGIVTADHVGGFGEVEEAGSSFAAPHVAGAIALMMGANPGWIRTPRDIKASVLRAAGHAYDYHTRAWVPLLQLTGLV